MCSCSIIDEEELPSTLFRAPGELKGDLGDLLGRCGRCAALWKLDARSCKELAGCGGKLSSVAIKIISECASVNLNGCNRPFTLLAEMKGAGAAELKRKHGKELKSAGFSCKKLKSAGFTFK